MRPYNKIPLNLEGKAVFLTDFQTRSFNALDEGRSISLSAPTSAGKSFILQAYLAKRFKENKKFNAVYLVPTKALISQIQRDFKKGLVDFGVSDVLISSTSNYDKVTDYPKKFFVLTQERFHNLLFDLEFNEPLNTLIIDEAQKVSDLSRGILLEEVIEEAISRNKNNNHDLQTIFISPFSKNPGKFSEMFSLKNLEIEKTNLAPV